MPHCAGKAGAAAGRNRSQARAACCCGLDSVAKIEEQSAPHDVAVVQDARDRFHPTAPARHGFDLQTMTLLYIVAATFAGGLLSVLIAASLTVGVLSRMVRHLVSLSAGVLLSTALLNVLPEAFESKASPHSLFATLLAGLLFFFLLEKAELYRHGHHHEHDEHHHHHGFDAEQAGRGGWSVLVGDSIHNFCDGIIIAAAFLVDVELGLVTSMAIIAHEIPQEVGDYIVLLNAGFSRAKALLYNALSGMAAVGGGVLGYFVIGPWEALFPYLLVVASSSFIYVAVADLIPQLQRRLGWRETLAQITWLGAGLVAVLVAVSALRH
jgi:zinc and cadmium transporter